MAVAEVLETLCSNHVRNPVEIAGNNLEAWGMSLRNRWLQQPLPCLYICQGRLLLQFAQCMGDLLPKELAITAGHQPG